MQPNPGYRSKSNIIKIECRVCQNKLILQNDHAHLKTHACEDSRNMRTSRQSNLDSFLTGKLKL